MVAFGFGLLGLGCFSISPSRVNLELDDTDVQQMAQKMAESLSRSCGPTASSGRPVIVMHKILNETTQILSPIFLAKLRTLLTRHAAGRMLFVLSRAAWDELDSERGRRGNDRGQDERLTPRFALGGTFYSHTLENKEGRSDYVLCTFQLSDLQTGTLVWEDSYDLKRRAHRELFD